MQPGFAADAAVARRHGDDVRQALHAFVLFIRMGLHFDARHKFSDFRSVDLLSRKVRKAEGAFYERCGHTISHREVSLHLVGGAGIGEVEGSGLVAKRYGGHLDTGENDFSACRRFEAEHGPNAALDAPMVLLDPVVEIFAPADADRVQ